MIYEDIKLVIERGKQKALKENLNKLNIHILNSIQYLALLNRMVYMPQK